MWRMLGYTVYVLWCLSWFPTIVGLLSEGGEKETARKTAIHLICAVNMAAFYIGGIFWLVKQCAGRRGTRICLAWVLFLFLSNWGPVVLAISGAALERFTLGSDTAV